MRLDIKTAWDVYADRMQPVQTLGPVGDGGEDTPARRLKKLPDLSTDFIWGGYLGRPPRSRVAVMIVNLGHLLHSNRGFSAAQKPSTLAKRIGR